MPIDDALFRKAMGSFTSGVTVVTTVHDNAAYGMTILAADQADISQHFASKITDKFTGINCSTTAAGIPVIANACATFECTLAHVLPGGDHSIVVGALNEAHVSDRAPLVYYRGGYHQLA